MILGYCRCCMWPTSHSRAREGQASVAPREGGRISLPVTTAVPLTRLPNLGHWTERDTSKARPRPSRQWGSTSRDMQQSCITLRQPILGHSSTNSHLLMSSREVKDHDPSTDGNTEAGTVPPPPVWFVISPRQPRG